MIFDDADDNVEVVESWEVLRLEELSSLVSGLSGQDNIQLKFGDRWAWSASQRTVLLPKHDLVDLNRCRAIASHEVGHVLFTRHMNDLNIPLKYKYIPSIFLHTMHNVYEDPRIEVAVGQVYPGTQHWLKQLHLTEEVEARSLMGMPIPLAMQFFFAHIREFHRDWKPLESGDVDPYLMDLLNKTRSDRIAMANMLPNTITERGAELDVACIAEVDIRLNREKGNWLTVIEQKKFLAQARMMQIMEGLTRDCAFHLYELDAQRIEQFLRNTDGVVRLDLQEIIQQTFENPVQVDSLRDVKAGPTAKQLLEEWYEGRRAAHGISTESDFRRAQQATTSRRSRRPIRHRGIGEDGGTETQSLIRTYEQMRMVVSDQIQKMTQELQNVLRPTKAAKWQEGYSSGSKLNLRRMIQREARNQGELDFWQRKTKVSKRNVAATLLIDLSGSMHGLKSEAALQGAILFWESLHALGVSTSISGFKRERISIVGFGDPLVQSNRKKVANMLNLVGSVNHDAAAIRSAFDELILQPADEHVLIVISDGQPVGANGEEELHRIIMKVKDRIRIVGLGLGEDTKHVEHYYPHAKGSIPIQDLSRQIGSVLQKILRRH